MVIKLARIEMIDQTEIKPRIIVEKIDVFLATMYTIQENKIVIAKETLIANVSTLSDLFKPINFIKHGPASYRRFMRQNLSSVQNLGDLPSSSNFNMYSSKHLLQSMNSKAFSRSDIAISLVVFLILERC